MRTTVLSLLLTLLATAVFAQLQLHIHQINIENGDATLVGIYDTHSQKYTAKILIDGGQLTPDQLLLPYLKKIIGSDKPSLHFEYVILSHYHDDHYNGLLGIQDGLITADSIIDPGGYKVDSYFQHSAVAGTPPDSMKKALPWLSAIKTAARHQPDPYVKGRSKLVLRYGTGVNTTIGNKITLGKIGANNVELRCIAGWGNTLSADDNVVANPRPKKSSANNFTLAFILSCGQFRYFIGGDMGGNNGSYINQETTVTKFLIDEYPKSVSTASGDIAKGHLCGFKANHHGSNESNTSGFIQGMRPAVVFTSAGSNSGWHLPNTEFLNRLANIEPLSKALTLVSGSFNKGVYFTNLYDFSQGASRQKANTLFKNKPGVSFDFGNDTAAGKCSYILKVTEVNTLNTKSQFEVGRVDLTKTNPYQRLAVFNCHTK